MRAPLPMQPAGEDALARAGLPLDQHRRQAAFQPSLGGDNRIELRVDEGEALAEKDPFGLVRGLRGAVLLSPRGAPGAPAAHKRQRQFLGLERLGEIIARAEAHGLNRLPHAAKRGHHHDAGVFRKRTLAQQLQHLAVGEVQVDQRELEAQLVQQVARLRQAGRLAHLGPEAAQVAGEPFAQGSIVLEQEDFAAGGQHGFVRHRCRVLRAKSRHISTQFPSAPGLPSMVRGPFPVLRILVLPG